MQNRVGPIVCRNLGRSANLSDCITVLTRGRVLAEGHYDRVSAELARPIMSRGASLGMRRNGGNGYYARIYKNGAARQLKVRAWPAADGPSIPQRCRLVVCRAFRERADSLGCLWGYC